ncbi:MAG: hypothetical protein WKF30_08930 [Pyrinomonadaceae bacterium]
MRTPGDARHLGLSHFLGAPRVARGAQTFDHRLCDVHHYPRDDLDSFVDSPQALGEFMDNRAAAALSINKPLVFGEFGMGTEGYQGFSDADWYRAYFAHAARVGAGGAMYWIHSRCGARLRHLHHGRDEAVRREFARAAQAAAAAHAQASAHLLDAGHHLIPRQFVFTQNKNEVGEKIVVRDEGEQLIYRFSPEGRCAGSLKESAAARGTCGATAWAF